MSMCGEAAHTQNAVLLIYLRINMEVIKIKTGSCAGPGLVGNNESFKLV